MPVEMPHKDAKSYTAKAGSSHPFAGQTFKARQITKDDIAVVGAGGWGEGQWVVWPEYGYKQEMDTNDLGGVRPKYTKVENPGPVVVDDLGDVEEAEAGLPEVEKVKEFEGELVISEQSAEADFDPDDPAQAQALVNSRKARPNFPTESGVHAKLAARGEATETPSDANDIEESDQKKEADKARSATSTTRTSTSSTKK